MIYQYQYQSLIYQCILVSKYQYQYQYQTDLKYQISVSNLCNIKVDFDIFHEDKTELFNVNWIKNLKLWNHRFLILRILDAVESLISYHLKNWICNRSEKFEHSVNCKTFANLTLWSQQWWLDFSKKWNVAKTSAFAANLVIFRLLSYFCTDWHQKIIKS